MATKVSVTASGDISTAISAGTASGDCGCASGSVSQGKSLSFALKSAFASADFEIGQALDEVSSPLAFVALPVPTSIEGRVLYLRIIDSGSLDVRVTHSTQGQTIYPVRGFLLLGGVSDDEYITAVAVQGEAQFEWLLTGDRA